MVRNKNVSIYNIHSGGTGRCNFRNPGFATLDRYYPLPLCHVKIQLRKKTLFSLRPILNPFRSRLQIFSFLCSASKKCSVRLLYIITSNGKLQLISKKHGPPMPKFPLLTFTSKRKICSFMVSVKASSQSRLTLWQIILINSTFHHFINLHSICISKKFFFINGQQKCVEM